VGVPPPLLLLGLVLGLSLLLLLSLLPLLLLLLPPSLQHHWRCRFLLPTAAGGRQQYQ
jgi:hypothetical protein